MLEKLYNFKKDSNHVKFFKWIWGVDPTVRYKTMCPYFWSYVATIIFLPIIVLFKLLGGAGNSINTKLIDYKNNKSKKLIDGLTKRILALSNLDHKDIEVLKQYYDIYRSKCFKKYRYNIDSELYSKVVDFADTYDDILDEIEVEKAQNEYSEQSAPNKYEYIKESKILRYIAMGIAIIGIMFVLYYVGLLIIFIYKAVEWRFVFIAIFVILSVSTILALIWKYIIVLFYEKVICSIVWEETVTLKVLKWIWVNVLGTIGRGVVNGIVIFVDMVKSQYKQSCPIITWEDK